MTVNVTSTGGNHNIDIIAVLKSILIHRPYPLTDQFQFKRIVNANTHKEIKNNRFQAMLDLMTDVHNVDSGIGFKFIDLDSLKFT